LFGFVPQPLPHPLNHAHRSRVKVAISIHRIQRRQHASEDDADISTGFRRIMPAITPDSL